MAAGDDAPGLVLDKIVPTGEYGAVYVEGGLAFTATQGYFQIMDLSNPFEPEVLRYFILPDVPGDVLVEDLVVKDGFAYLALGQLGLRVLDLREPWSISQVWVYGPEEGFAGHAVQLYVDGGHLFVAAASGGLYLFDIGSPAIPVLLVNRDEYPVGDVKADGTTLYMTENSLGYQDHEFEILDISDPQNPVVTGWLDLPSLGFGGIPAFDVLDGRAYLVMAQDTFYGYEVWLAIIDVSDPEQPVVLSESDTIGGPFGPQIEIALHETFVYISGTRSYISGPYFDSDLFILNAANSNAPVLIGSIEFPGPIFDMFGNDAALFAAGRTFRTGLFPVRSAADMTEFGLPAPQDMVIEKATYSGHFTGYEGLTWDSLRSPDAASYDVAVPPEFELFGRYLFEFAWFDSFGVSVRGNFSAYDLVNAPHLDPLFECKYPTCPFDQPEAAALAGDRLYVRTEDELTLLDFSNPHEFAPIGSIPFPTGYTKLAAVDDILFAGLTNGFEVFDFSDPLNPVSLAVEPVAGPTNDLVLIGDRLYLSASGAGLVIFDVSDPSNPVNLGELATPGTANEIVIEYPFAFMADGPGGLRVIDISEPAVPVEVAFFDNVLDATQVAVDRSTIWLLDPEGMTFVFRFGHSVFGTVIDKHGNALPGIDIAADLVGSRSTNWAGNFSFDFLNPGQLTITPYFSGHTFYPASRTATVPPDAGSQTFIMLGPPASVAVSPALSSALTYTDTQSLPTTAVFPPGSVAIAGTAYLTPTLAVSFPGYTFAFHAFDLDFPALENCAVPVELAITYSELDQSAVSDPSAVALWQLGPSGRIQVSGGVISTIGDVFMLEVEICTPGRYALFGPSNLLYLPMILE